MNTNLLRDTFARARQENGGATALGMRFYERLFEKYPAVNDPEPWQLPEVRAGQ